ncbi:hypothetical protein DFP72DRAFT_801082 [Ephemerocybe angulata]|uniref:Uncharacterized protein n=1 Tax=Ephemerocybe angulata TaxID=980116 RepID=A0A8H6IF50_9AGAR|nr:hypothetical protein DFP72DRAFT_801082 [Tulosesus angulatus]
MPEPVEPPRIIPGAPPKEPAATKSQKRRRKAKSKADAANDDAALSVAEATPAPPTHKSLEPEENLLAPEPVQTEATSPVVEDEGPLLSPIVELVNKRLKATTKKIGRITSYANTDPEKLNDDQKRTLKTLPTLEAVQKELGEVKKAIETYEADLASGLAAKRLDAEKAEKTRIRNAVESTKTDLISKTSDLLAFLQLSPSLGAIDGSAFFADDLERSAVSSLTNALLSDDDERKQVTLNGFLLGTGEFDGVSFTRISEIVQSLLNPPRAPTPTQDSPIDDRQQSVSAPSISGDDVQPPNLTNPPGTGSFHFMQESELEVEVEGEPAEPSAHFDESESAEWVEEKPVEEAAATAVVGVVANGHTPVPAVPAGGSTLDWSAENQDGDLPPIESLGPSGSATPAEQEAPVVVEQANGLSPVEGEEGFAPREGHRGGRGGRGRHYHRGGRGGPFRGGERGGFRGGERGGYRGGERGEHGERGERREPHEHGERGERRERPDRGPRGERGERPEHGERGPRGEHGHGERGPRGDRPFRGGNGEQGPNGEPRENGGFRGGRGGKSLSPVHLCRF